MINFSKINNIINNIDNYYNSIKLNKDYIGSVAIHLVDHCNLNCKGCDNFSPLCTERFETISNYKNMLERLRYLFNKSSIRMFILLGGEPMLHPDIIDFCKITRKLFPTSIIMIKTNGIPLLKKDDNFYSDLSKYDVIIRITKYPLDIDWSDVINKCKDNNIKLLFKADIDMYKINISLDMNDGNNYYNCNFSSRDKNFEKKNNRLIDYHCCYLNSNGDFYFCTIPALIHIFNNYFNYNFLTIKGKDYVNIYEEKTNENIIYGSQNILPFCKYCGKRYDKYEWDISKKDIKEWLK